MAKAKPSDAWTDPATKVCWIGRTANAPHC
jgi:hypothetical protein